MLKDRIQGLVVGVVIGAVMTGGIVFAKQGQEMIAASYNNIKIYIDGAKIDPKDANGNPVEPFIYNGTTYLPIRAVGEALNKLVDWDGTTQSVYIGKRDNVEQTPIEVLKPYQSSGYGEVDSNNNISMGGVKYYNGFCMGDNSSECYALFNLNGQYKKITGKLGHIDGQGSEDKTVEFYMDGKIVKTIVVKNQELPQRFELDVTGVLQLKILTSRNSCYICFTDLLIE